MDSKLVYNIWALFNFACKSLEPLQIVKYDRYIGAVDVASDLEYSWLLNCSHGWSGIAETSELLQSK